jgi:hypothetical protein
MSEEATESRALTTRQEQYQAIKATNPLGEVGAMLDAFMAMAKDPNVDAHKFEVIARVAKETREDAQKQQFYQAKASAMLDMPVIDKRGKIVIIDKNDPNNRAKDRVQGSYAKWPDLQRAITPVLASYDLVLTHDIGHEGAIVTVTPVLAHRNGYVERGEQMALPLDTSGGKNNTQGAGSAASYGKRHTSIAMLGLRLEDTDDDGWLTATPDEPLNDQQERRVEEAKARWADGPEVYEQWFGRLEPKDRAWLIQTGRHADITGKEAGLLIAHSVGATDTGPPAQRDPAKPAKAAKSAATDGHDTSTPEGWTAKYEEDCRTAPDLDALARVQAKGANAMKKLQGSDATLHARAVKAGSDAYGRLSGIDQQGGDDLFVGGDE